MKKPVTDEELEKMKKKCECANCGYPIRIFPGIDCPRCRRGEMIKQKNCIYNICSHVENIIPGKNYRKCYDEEGKMIEVKFSKN